MEAYPILKHTNNTILNNIQIALRSYSDTYGISTNFKRFSYSTL